MSAERPAADGSPRRILFREEQRFRQPWLWAPLAVIIGVAWWGFVQQIVLGRPFGTNPAPNAMVWVLFGLVGLGLPILMFTIRLVVEVDTRGVMLRFRPFRTRRVEAREILSATARSYRPLRDYGGWGIRYAWGRGWAYTVRGHHGVEIGLPEGKSLLIGSERAEELAAALSGLRSPGERE